MAEETPAATAAPVSPAVEAAPAVVAAVETVAPVTTAPVEASVAPVVETAAPVAEVKTEPPAEAAKPLLDPEAKPAEAVADTPKVEGEAPKTELAPIPVYEFKLPEGANADNPIFKSFQTKLGEFQNLSKAEQSVVNKFGQEMLDMHMADVQEVVKASNQSAWDWFNNRNKEWLESAKKDPVIGGDNFDKTVSDATQSVRLYGGTKAQQIETANLFKETGLENSPVLLRFLSNITKIAAKEGQPVSGTNVPTQKAGIAEMMYGGKKTA